MHLLDIQTAPLSNIRKRSFEECVEIVLGAPGARSNYLGWAIIGVLSWTIWLTRNDLVFNDIVCSSPCNNVFKTISLLTQWARTAPAKREQGWKLMLQTQFGVEKSAFLDEAARMSMIGVCLFLVP